MKFKTIVSLLGILAFSSGLVYAGYWYAKPTIKDLSERNLALAATDSTRLIELEDDRIAHERIVFDFVKDKELLQFVQDSMGDIAAGLVSEIESHNRTIESLVTANATLRVRLRDTVAVESSDVGFDVRIDTKKRFEDGSIEVAGTVTVDTTDNPPSGTVDLNVSVVTQPTVSISRGDDGLAQCNISFGDMPMTVENLLCVNDLDPDLGTRGSVWGLLGVSLGTGAVVGGLALLVFLATF